MARMGKNKGCGVDKIQTEFPRQMVENGRKCLTKKAIHLMIQNINIYGTSLKSLGQSV